MDWNITDSHLLEFTAFSDEQETDTNVYANPLGVAAARRVRSAPTRPGTGRRQLRPEVHRLPDRQLHPVGARTATASSRVRSAWRTGGWPGSYSATSRRQPTQRAGHVGCPQIVDARPGYRQDITGIYGSTCNLTNGAIDRSRELGRRARPVPYRRRMAAGRPPAPLRLRRRQLHVGRRPADRRRPAVALLDRQPRRHRRLRRRVRRRPRADRQPGHRRTKSSSARSTSRTAGTSPTTSSPTSACAGIRSRTSTASATRSSRSTTSSARASASRGTSSATPRSRSSVTPAATRCR